MKKRTLPPQTEQAIMLTLLEVPEFRRKAGLPLRDSYHGGDSLGTLGRLLGCSREAIRVIEARALRRLRTACCHNPELQLALRHLMHR